MADVVDTARAPVVMPQADAGAWVTVPVRAAWQAAALGDPVPGVAGLEPGGQLRPDSPRESTPSATGPSWRPAHGQRRV
ncbi:hypothetical protein [Streptomyces sp. NPDC002537]